MENENLIPEELQGNHGQERSKEGDRPESLNRIRDTPACTLDHDHQHNETTARLFVDQDNDVISVVQTALPQSNDAMEGCDLALPLTNGSDNTDCEKEIQGPPYRRRHLGYSGYIFLLAALYATLMLFAWIVLCILTHRPIATKMKHYGWYLDKPPTFGTAELTSATGVSFDGPGTYGWVPERVFHAIFTRSNRYLRAAQFIRSAVSVTTIPLISAVCSKAAVLFAQRRHQTTLSLRQTMTLADRGWTDPSIYFRLLSGGFKQHATSFLVLAIFLNILGS
jgi:hypothetical protein